MKWNADHNNYGLDPMLDHYRYYTGVIYNLFPEIGAHQNREMVMMTAAMKPCAIIDAHRFELMWQTHCETHGWHFYKTVKGCNYYVALPDHRWRITALQRIYRQIAEKGFMSNMDHARVGCLLGYRKQEITVFLNSLKHN